MVLKLILLTQGAFVAHAFSSPSNLSPISSTNQRAVRRARALQQRGLHATPITSEELPQIIPTKGVPIHLYSTEIEPQALAQLKVLAESPVPTDYVSAMPDVHLGMGVTIGSVFASEQYVCPNAVGVDIGCGMAAIPIDGLYKWDLKPDDLNQIQQELKEKIPTGFNMHQKTQPGAMQVLDEITEEVGPTEFLKEQLLLPRVTDQLGTLGGGK